MVEISDVKAILSFKCLNCIQLQFSSQSVFVQKCYFHIVKSLCRHCRIQYVGC